jgi:nitrite reductase/ring-hydroxylating ferredoxin subunit
LEIGEESASPINPVVETAVAVAPQRTDGYLLAAALEDIPATSGLTVELLGNEYALFRQEDGVKCIDSACPHEGASLADGEFKDGIVTCPWHAWTFDACTGCSLDPPGNDVKAYETKVEDGNVFIKLNASVAESPAASGVKKPVRPVEAEL